MSTTPGEMVWNGQLERLSGWLDKHAPKIWDVSAAITAAYIKSGAFREGGAFKVKTLQKVQTQVSFFSAWKISMETGIMADEAANRASDAVLRLDAITKEFRSNTKNDISSMKAASERLQNEVAQMTEKYKQAMGLLNSDEFANAVLQAERMAKALECISALSDTKINVSLLSGPQ